MRTVFAFFLLLFLHFNTAQAQQLRPWTSVQIYEKLNQLNKLGTVMYLAAHPDDENTRLLSYLVHHEHLNTVYLSLTRGDGGQNLIGTELGIELGLIRNYELIAARDIDGAEQAFSSVIDFGYSKTPEETFAHWDKQRLIDEVKSAIKKYRPDVIICRFPTTGEGGHGQHTASAIVAKEAYEQLEKEGYLHLPERVLFNAFRFGNRNTTNESQFKIETNQYNALLGESYGEMAGRSRSIHRSQGAGTPQSIGIQQEYFAMIAGKQYQDRLIDADLSWARIGRADIGQMISKIIENYDFTAPEKSLGQLAAVRRQILSISDDYSFFKNKKLKEVEELMLSAAGIMGEIFSNKPEMIAGEATNLNIQIIARAKDIQLNSLTLPGVYKNLIESQGVHLQQDRTYIQKQNWSVPDDQIYTQPYWLAETPDAAWYKNADQIHEPESSNHLVAQVAFSIAGEEVNTQIPISYKYLHPLKGDVVQGLRIIPEVFVTPIQSLYYRDADTDLELSFKIKNNKSKTEQATIQITSDGRKHEHKTRLPLPGKDSVYTIVLPAEFLGNSRTEIQINVQDQDGHIFSKEQRLISYDHLPELVYYKDAMATIVTKQWVQPKGRIGYIAGAGDLVFDHLKAMGMQIELLPDAWLSDLNMLQQFDVLVCGIRAYNTNNTLAASKDQIMAYIHQGGNFIIQYNTTANLITKDIGPYDFEIGRNRVTDEHAAITLLRPEDKTLNTPNKINQSDFEDWHQERGLYFAQNIDPAYITIMSMADKGEPQLKEGVFYTPYGEGHFVYTSLAFFRQIPKGHEGAIKLFLNLMSL